MVRVEYELPVLKGVEFSVGSFMKTFNIDGIEIEWIIHQGDYLDRVILKVHNLSIIMDDSGVIIPRDSEVEDRCYKVASYITDYTFFQTGVDIINPDVILTEYPKVYAENQQEAEVFANHKMELSVTFDFRYNIGENFDPNQLTEKYEYHIALVHYAEASRSKNIVIQYEQFYKVLEYFFPNKKGELIDKAVSQHIVHLNSKFNQDKIKELRQVRRNSMHPERPDHIYSSDRSSLSKLKSVLPELREVAWLLIKNPPR